MTRLAYQVELIIFMVQWFPRIYLWFPPAGSIALFLSWFEVTKYILGLCKAIVLLKESSHMNGLHMWPTWAETFLLRCYNTSGSRILVGGTRNFSLRFCQQHTVELHEWSELFWLGSRVLRWALEALGFYIAKYGISLILGAFLSKFWNV